MSATPIENRPPPTTYEVYKAIMARKMAKAMGLDVPPSPLWTLAPDVILDLPPSE